MSVYARARKSAFGGIVVLAGILLVACGGGGAAKGKPMVADPPYSSDTDLPWSGEDGGVASSDGDKAPSSDAPPPSSSEAPSSAAILQGNEDGARALLSQFVAPNADHLALTRSLRPTSSDYKSLFDAKAAAKIEAAQAKEWDSNKAVIKPKPGQTEIKVWSATGSDLAKGTGNAKEFPGGYKKVAKHLAPSVLFFRFKFVEAGKDTGTAYDGLAFVNGHWVIAPKPWRAMEGKSGSGMDEEEAAPPEKPEKPEKPAGKKKPKGKKR
jgi:hypothetical protein